MMLFPPRSVCATFASHNGVLEAMRRINGGKRGMSISDRDVAATAKLLIKQHNGSAAYYAAGRADDLLDAGDTEGAAVWRRVAKAAEELLAMEPADETKR